MDELLTVFFWASAVRLAAPMFIAAIGETVVQRAGMFNVGIEGMMLIGAFVGVAARSGGATYTGVITAAVVTGVVGLLYGIVIAVLRADQIVAGVGLNIIAIGSTSLLRRLWGLSAEGAVPAGILGEQPVPVLVDIPFLGGVLFRQSPLVYLAYVVLPMVAFFLLRTRSGLLLRSVGESAVAADSAGVSVLSKRVWAVTFGGVMAGLAGAYLSVVATSGVFIDNMTLGRGFLAIAITILAGWRPGWVAAAALFFGAAEALQFSSQAVFGASVPAPLLLMLPFVATIVAWSLVGRAGRIPGDLGRPFVRGES